MLPHLLIFIDDRRYKLVIAIYFAFFTFTHAPKGIVNGLMGMFAISSLGVYSLSGIFGGLILSFIGWGGIVGLVAAWIRIVCTSDRLSRSGRLFRFTLIGLITGNIAHLAFVCIIYLESQTFSMIQLPNILAYLLLLLATIGIRLDLTESY